VYHADVKKLCRPCSGRSASSRLTEAHRAQSLEDCQARTVRAGHACHCRRPCSEVTGPPAQQAQIRPCALIVSGSHALGSCSHERGSSCRTGLTRNTELSPAQCGRVGLLKRSGLVRSRVPCTVGTARPSMLGAETCPAPDACLPASAAAVTRSLVGSEGRRRRRPPAIAVAVPEKRRAQRRRASPPPAARTAFAASARQSNADTHTSITRPCLGPPSQPLARPGAGAPARIRARRTHDELARRCGVARASPGTCAEMC